MRYRATISYFGAPYVGWQRQINGLSVQEVLEQALAKTFSKETSATASGRTDAGVHAEGQVVHFDADTSIPLDKIPFAVNSHLPKDISMLDCMIASADFNARFCAKRKTYCYKIYLSQHVRPLLEATESHVVQPLNMIAMVEACKIIEGTHDFKCFEASGSVVKNTVRTIYDLSIVATPFAITKERQNERQNEIQNEIQNERQSEKLNERQNERQSEKLNERQNERQSEMLNEIIVENSEMVFNSTLAISVTGNGFLYNMVRIIAGTLVYVGLNKLSLSDVSAILESGNRAKAGKTLPPQGLHLVSVEY